MTALMPAPATTTLPDSHRDASGALSSSSTSPDGWRCPCRPCSSPERRPTRPGASFDSPRENGAAWRLAARRASSNTPSSLPTRASSRSFSPVTRVNSTHNRSFSAANTEHNAASRSTSASGSAENTSTSDTVTATTTTRVRGRLHNPCYTR